MNIGLGYAIRIDEKGENRYVFISKEGEILAIYKNTSIFLWR